MHPSRKGWVMYLISLSFFMFQFALRVFPGVIMSDLIAHYQVSATEFGIFSASFYLGYSGCQILIGYLLDRYPPRNVISLFAFICTLGTFLISCSPSWNLVVLGRFLVGVGSAVGFLGTAKIVRSVFQAKHYSKMISITFVFGLLGAIFGGKPISLLVGELGWQTLACIFSLVGLAISAMIFLFFPCIDTSASRLAHTASRGLRDSLAELVKRKEVLWVSAAGALMVGPLEGFADIWGVSYFTNVQNFSRAEATWITFFIYFGMIIGSLVLPALSTRLKRPYAITALCGLLIGTLFLFILLSSGFSKNVYIVLMTLVGVLCCYQVIVFDIVNGLVPTHLSGLATSFVNCINVATGCVIHSSIGWMMDYFWMGDLKGEVKIYPEKAYIFSIAIIPALSFAGFLCILLLRFFGKKRPHSAFTTSR